MDSALTVRTRAARLGGRVGLLALVLLLAACAGPKYTVDDGRKVNEELLGQIRAYGDGERAVRPAIARSAALKDPDCDKQWELPISVATSQSWSKDDRVAWVRGLGVDERLTVVGVVPGVGLQLGDKIESIDGYDKADDAEAMTMRLVRHRDSGRPFSVRVAGGRHAKLVPFEVCRGYARFAPPNTPKLQDYHWLMSMHPLEVTQARLTDDEALWVVLWSQGLSEEGGLRMKAYHYGSQIVGTLYNLATLASGLKGAALAAEQAVKAAQSAAAAAATEVLKQQLIEQAKALATQKLREGVTDAADKLARQQVLGAMQQAAANRGSLSGVSRIGATVFDRADLWAFERAGKLQADPLAGFRLHQKMIEQQLTANVFLFDAERLEAISKAADAKGLTDDVVAVLKGLDPKAVTYALSGMPLASLPSAFSYEDPDDGAPQPFARGLVDAMLDMPVESKGK